MGLTGCAKATTRQNLAQPPVCAIRRLLVWTKEMDKRQTNVHQFLHNTIGQNDDTKNWEDVMLLSKCLVQKDK